jgi:hypothetical protein
MWLTAAMAEQQLAVIPSKFPIPYDPARVTAQAAVPNASVNAHRVIVMSREVGIEVSFMISSEGVAGRPSAAAIEEM